MTNASQTNQLVNYAGRTYNYLKENVDWKKGLFFATLVGGIVAGINYREGWEYALSSGLKEGAKCMVVGTTNLSICQTLAKSIKSKTKAYLLATAIPTALSIGLTYGVHAGFRGTPHPVQSTAPTALSAPFFLVLGAQARRKQDKKKIQSSQTLEQNLGGAK